MSKINVITQYYKVKYNNVSNEQIKQRQHEITSCIKLNLEHPDVKQVHFLIENMEDLQFLSKEGIPIHHDKLILYYLGDRIKYSSLFEYVNKFIPNETCVYLHADMYIDKGFSKLTDFDSKKIYALTSHNPKTCNRSLVCNCTRQFKTPKGWFGVTFDGFVFRTPIKESVIKKANHTTNRLGAETRLIAILKNNGYDVLSPNNILTANHYHFIKIFNDDPKFPTKKTWINLEGDSIPIEYYSNIHKTQINKPWEQRIVGGGIPFYLGSVQLVNHL